MHHGVLRNSCQSHSGVKRNSVALPRKAFSAGLCSSLHAGMLSSSDKTAAIVASALISLATDIVFCLGFFRAACSSSLSLSPPLNAKKGLIGNGMHRKLTPVIKTKRAVCCRRVDKEKYFIQLAENFSESEEFVCRRDYSIELYLQPLKQFLTSPETRVLLFSCFSPFQGLLEICLFEYVGAAGRRVGGWIILICVRARLLGSARLL